MVFGRGLKRAFEGAESGHQAGWLAVTLGTDAASEANATADAAELIDWCHHAERGRELINLNNEEEGMRRRGVERGVSDVNRQLS